MIWFTSDLHLCHNRGFIYAPRGFKSIYEMNETIVENWNSVVKPEDDVYILGDLMLNDNEAGAELVRNLNGKLHIVFGNHDTDTRRELYRTFCNVVECADALRFNAYGYHFFLTHYPCITGSLEHESLKKTTINLFGHTHSKDKFYQDMPFMYNVALDAHNCFPVCIEDILNDCKNKVEECLEQL